MKTEDPEHRLKRLRMRAWRRGTKEMDLILGRWADAQLAGLSPEELSQFDAILAENDQDLYQWVTGQAEPPGPMRPMLIRIAEECGAAGDD